MPKTAPQWAEIQWLFTTFRVNRQMPTPRKSQERHRLDGTFRKDRHGSGRLPIELPPMPADLSEAAQSHWNAIGSRLVQAGLITAIDGPALRLLCESLEAYTLASDELRRDGLTLIRHTRNGSAANVHPAHKIRSAAWSQVLSLLCDFGLTPRSRLSLSPDPGGDDDIDLSGILGFPIN